MQKTLYFLLTAVLLIPVTVSAQDVETYKTPPSAIAELLLAKPTPFVYTDSKGVYVLAAERSSYPSVEELGQPEIKVAGLRLNPLNFSPTRQNYINNFRLKVIKTGIELGIDGLPITLLATNVSWNPSETKIAFINVLTAEADLYVIDLAEHRAVKWNKVPLNNTLRNAYTWLNDSSIVYKAVVNPAAEAPKKAITPSGPSIQQSLGKVAPSPTFQDLIKSPYDEKLFEFYCTSQLIKNTKGQEVKVGEPAIYLSNAVSPDKKYMLNKTVHKPYSYLVTAYGFPSTVTITDTQGAVVKTLAELPSTEIRPSGSDNLQNVPRAFAWRDDEAATVIWSAPLDSGLIKKQVEFHDAVYALKSPFTAEKTELFKTAMRYYGATWGDSTIAWVEEGLNTKQQLKFSLYNTVTKKLETVLERNETDAYGDPGDPVLSKNKYNRYVIVPIEKGKKILMNNQQGSTPKGDLPFVAKFDLATKKNEIVWRCGDGSYEFVTDVLDPVKMVFITRKESPKEPPNYFVKTLKSKLPDKQITSFPNPYPQLKGVTIQKIFYKRADSVSLTGTLYLPAGYNKDKDGPLPTLLWAYPREFNSAADAAQVRGSQYSFAVLGWGSPIYYVTQGYAVLDNAEMPIVAKNDGSRPNDNFIEQLTLNAEAAIGKLSALGVSDKNRVAVGGHSYGAFMTANLLAHTSLFKAGIARSGAYNRTLTPFGFQNEDRTYWQAPKLYFEMSPFSYADKIKTPLLMIHGEADDNTGTFPINSERLFNAIKGNGGIVRLVFLPYEAHGYRGKENLLHMHAEQFNWLETYVKGKK